ncbi:MAG: hypothetical protein D6701_06205 [Gemmatimonadetes bacterium]|nr:MAG: hypothetical protein D6701_06205 [Gemmatimonadota bacterium]
MTVRSPTAVAADLAAQAPDPAWLRALADALDRRVRTQPLERFMTLWDLSRSEAARVFGVSRQAFSKWLTQGVPPGRAPAVAALAAATDQLDRRLKRERIPAVVRRPARMLAGRSLLELAHQGRYEAVRDAVEAMFDLRRVQA